MQWYSLINEVAICGNFCNFNWTIAKWPLLAQALPRLSIDASVWLSGAWSDRLTWSHSDSTPLQSIRWERAYQSAPPSCSYIATTLEHIAVMSSSEMCLPALNVFLNVSLYFKCIFLLPEQSENTTKII